jgi:hypothetical protein
MFNLFNWWSSSSTISTNDSAPVSSVQVDINPPFVSPQITLSPTPTPIPLPIITPTITPNILPLSPSSHDTTLHLLILLDKSGSMEDHKSEIISGFNSFLSSTEDQLRHLHRACNFTLVTFNQEHHISRQTIGSHLNLTKENYKCSGRTALYDAIGTSLSNFRETQDMMIVIVTDGLDNCSRKYDQKLIASMIADGKTNKNWRFVYLAADPSLIKQGDDMNIGYDNNSVSCSVDFSKFSTYVKDSLSQTIGNWMKKIK